jgi:hypothetical protein
VKVAEEEKVAPRGGGRPLYPPEAVDEAARRWPWCHGHDKAMTAAV